MSSLLIFGAGFSARQSAIAASDQFDRIAGTTRTPGKFEYLREAGIDPVQFAGMPTSELSGEIAGATHLLVSIAPEDDGDPVLSAFETLIASSPSLQWICYLSTVGVYGDHQGGWVDEQSACRPVSKRSLERLAAEDAWTALAQAAGKKLAILRLSGIYGPGRNAFVNIENGTSRRLVKPGQVFNRIHRDDIATAFALAARQQAQGVFNITDDEPAPPQDVVTYAHALMGVAPPPETDFATAQLSPMARSFYGENKRVSNARSKQELGLEYAYPDYRTAFARMWRDKSWR